MRKLNLDDSALGMENVSIVYDTDKYIFVCKYLVD